MRERAAGLLLHPTSLPGRFGIGDLGPECDAFLDWAASAGQSVWQVLPLGPTGYGNSPYGTLSAFAGNPMLLSPELLVADGLLPGSALEHVPGFPEHQVDFERVIAWKEGLLREVWRRFRADGPAHLRAELQGFGEAPAQRYWLSDWALFMALKGRYGGAAFREWPEELRRRQPAALARVERELADDVAWHVFLQFLFFRQWDRVKEAAHERGIRILGDIPIYVSPDSADVWSHPEIFELDEAGDPVRVAGVPPDYFSATGQLWGNPLYRWDVLERDGFHWWVERLRANLRLTELLRLDHFRGFAGYWAVAAGEETAIGGAWEPGPGRKLFDALAGELGPLDLVAEDLGEITPDVTALVEELGLPGMKILQFAWDGDDQDYQPHNHVPNGVVYTGTHDNDTTRGWWEKAGDATRHRVRAYLGGDGADPIGLLVRAAYASVAFLAVLPVQDVFGLGSEARMNTPGQGADNWAWRARRWDFNGERAAWLRELATLTGRFRSRGDAGPNGSGSNGNEG
jgi:4-alpha-glucanotransferase